jgi:hypothetical protein
MLRKALIRAAKTSHTAQTLCAFFCPKFVVPGALPWRLKFFDDGYQEFKVSKFHGTMEAWAGNYSRN